MGVGMAETGLWECDCPPVASLLGGCCAKAAEDEEEEVAASQHRHWSYLDSRRQAEGHSRRCATRGSVARDRSGHAGTRDLASGLVDVRRRCRRGGVAGERIELAS